VRSDVENSYTEVWIRSDLRYELGNLFARLDGLPVGLAKPIYEKLCDDLWNVEAWANARIGAARMEDRNSAK
jgi:hypothetical protein